MTEGIQPASRTLILMRHAKAEHVEGKDDIDRGLTARGRADATAAGAWLAEHDLTLDLVLCSVSQRTRQTWAAMVDGGATGRDVRYEDSIYNGGSGAMLRLVTEADPLAGVVLVVGHAPSVPWLTDTLAADGTGSAQAHAQLEEGFPTCAFAVLKVDTAWFDLAAGAAELSEFVVPRG
ncbi:MAG TPA: histidine phosphatase family protein [Dermatophilaceae bacterium]|nr:histidine phosphatase family protein [Dermatophilaceae bacterium]